MTAQTPFTMATYDSGFDPAVKALIPTLMSGVALPGPWRMTRDHPYAYDNHIVLGQMDNDIWGVANSRNVAQAQTELLIARLAAMAGMPAAPTFLAPIRLDGGARVISVIPYKNIVHSVSFPFERMASYMRHFASTLPFLLSLGAKTDRSNHCNRCINADKPSLIAEFDFATSDIKRLLEINWGVPQLFAANKLHEKTMYGLSRKTNYASDVAENLVRGWFRIPRADFEDGLMRLQAMPDDALPRTLALVHAELPFRKDQVIRLTEFMQARKAGLFASYASGHFDNLLSDTVPQENYVDQKVVAERIAKHTYTFA